jgi:hypothetical protein
MPGNKNAMRFLAQLRQQKITHVLSVDRRPSQFKNMDTALSLLAYTLWKKGCLSLVKTIKVTFRSSRVLPDLNADHEKRNLYKVNPEQCLTEIK